MEFKVDNAAFAAYLVASKKLTLLRVEATPTLATIIFDDPNNVGTALELDFLSGGALIPAATFHHSFRLVRRSIEIKKAEARNAGAK